MLSGTDLGIVARMRELGSADRHRASSWRSGVSARSFGALVYGGLSRSISTFWLLGALALVTLPMALAHGALSLAVLAFVAGLLCAPTITASVDQASRIVPASARGEAMGWHGSSLTLGGALGAPFAGLAIDEVGAGGGFVAPAVVGLARRPARARWRPKPAGGGTRPRARLAPMSPASAPAPPVPCADLSCPRARMTQSA